MSYCVIYHILYILLYVSRLSTLKCAGLHICSMPAIQSNLLQIRFFFFFNSFYEDASPTNRMHTCLWNDTSRLWTCKPLFFCFKCFIKNTQTCAWSVSVKEYRCHKSSVTSLNKSPWKPDGKNVSSCSRSRLTRFKKKKKNARNGNSQQIEMSWNL